MASITTLTIVVGDRKNASKEVNEILSEYGDEILARMGIPIKDKNISLITVIMKSASGESADAISMELSRIDCVKVNMVREIIENL